jgi:hypothetical protein
MKIFTQIIYRWNGTRYVIDSSKSFDYAGPIALMCGPTGAQNAIQGQQSQFSQQLTQQAGTIFGSSSNVFNDLVGSFAPTVAAGPSQNGFSAQEKSGLDSQAITDTGNAYKNAKAAVGDAASAVGGGNTGDVTGGSTTGADLSVANAAAAQTSDELGQINLADEQQGQQNYDNAASGLLNSTSVFNPSTDASGAATKQQSATADTANQIATQDNSWMQAVSGALGAVGGAVATGGMKNLGSGVGFFGQNA